MNLSRLWNFRAGLTRLLANPWMRKWFRLGHGAKGFLYGLVGLFILKNLRFEDQQVGGTDLVISTLDNRLFGNIILIFLALGLLGYSLWRLIQAGLDPAHSGDKNLRHVAQRIGYGISCLTYLGVAYSATRLGIGLAVDFDDSVEDLASFFFEYTFGPWLLLAVSAGVFLVGCLYIYGAISQGFISDFQSQLDDSVAKGTIVIGQVGFISRGVSFMLIGLFLVQAALDVDDEVAGGLGPTLSQVRDQPLGVVWLGLIALGFLGYGVHMVMAAFYRKFPR